MKPMFGSWSKSFRLDADVPWYLGERGDAAQFDGYLPWYVSDWGASDQFDGFLPWYVADAAKDPGSTGSGALNLGSKQSRLPTADGEPSVSTFDVAPTAIPTDEFFGLQWHLQNTGQVINGVSGTPGIDINVVGVWDDYTGAGVIIGDVDSGIEYNHPDLVGGINTEFAWDAIDHDDDASAEAGENHGTAVTGTIVATAGNDIGVVGVAYDAEAAGFRMGFGTGGEAQILDNFERQGLVDISNNSWGYNGFFFHDFDSDLFRDIGLALEDAISTGRDGLGTVFVFSAGNDRAYGQDVNYHSFGNSPYTITVAAIDNTGVIADFSTPGAPILVSAPGVDIATTDRVGSAGYVEGNYVYISGTSFSSPITAGVVALMLEANSDLGYRDVQEILAYSARQIDAGDAGWAFNGADDWNGGGLHFSHDYGAGLIDAHAAVRLAETWTSSSTLATLETVSVFQQADLAIPDAGGGRGKPKPGIVSDTISIETGLQIDHVSVRVEIGHTFIGDLTITLTSPDGTTSLLVDTPPTGQDDIRFDLTSTQFWGETGVGNWTLTVTDSGRKDVGTLESWELALYGDTITNDDTYIFTDEYATFTSPEDAARRILTDGAGIDTINAAAITSNTTLYLTPGATSWLAGNSLTISSGTDIENAFLGDGDDFVTGNHLDNVISGGRGDDRLDGGAGNDTLIGGDGSDLFVFSSMSDGTDTITDFTTGIVGDVLDFAMIFATIMESTAWDGTFGDLGNYLELFDDGFDTTVGIDINGGGAYQTIVVLSAVTLTNDNLLDLLLDGNIDVGTVSDISRPTNLAPTVALHSTTTDLAENADTSSPLKVADIVVTDDGVGTYVLTLVGTDAALFEIVGTELFLKAGTVLDFESNPSLDVTVEVDDVAVAGFPDDTASLLISVTDVNEAPTVTSANTTTMLAENADTSSPLKVADIVVTDDALGTNVLTLEGADAALFEIVGTELFLKAGTVLDFVSNPSLDVTVKVDDDGVGADMAPLSIDVTEFNVAPPFVFSTTGVGSVFGVDAFEDEDLLEWNGSAFELLFDGSDHQLGRDKNRDINAVDVLANGDIVFSIKGDKENFGGINFEEEDLILWDGAAYSMFFEGDPNGLDGMSEDIDAVHVVNADYFIFSTSGNGSAGGVSWADEDLVLFENGAFSVFWDGSDHGLKSDLDAVDLLANGDFVFSTMSPVTLEGTDFDDSDLILWDGTTFSMYFDGSDPDGSGTLNGLAANEEDIDAVALLGGATLNGAAGNAVLIGGASDDTLVGGSGNDSLTGGAGDDLFVFADGAGDDTVTDFDAGAGSDDVLDVTAFGFASFAEVTDAASQVDADTLIQLDVDDSVTLLGVNVEDLHPEDVLF